MISDSRSKIGDSRFETTHCVENRGQQLTIGVHHFHPVDVLVCSVALATSRPGIDADAYGNNVGDHLDHTVDVGAILTSAATAQNERLQNLHETKGSETQTTPGWSETSSTCLWYTAIHICFGREHARTHARARAHAHARARRP